LDEVPFLYNFENDEKIYETIDYMKEHA